MKNKVLFMMVAILAMASNLLADNGLGNRADNGLGNIISSVVDAVVALINGLGN
ncbi:MAG: hypothetical protein AAB336_00415 [Acidobacteriota bacterium]